MADAVGNFDGDPCPECGQEGTIRFRFAEGFDELECPTCGYRSDAEVEAELRQGATDLLRSDKKVPVPTALAPLRA